MGHKINFTQKILETSRPLKPGDRLVLIDKTPGLQCRITYNGTVTFSVYKRMGAGRIERVTIGRYPAVSIEQARKSATKINARIADGGNPAEIKRAHKEELTFSELYSEYLETYSKPKKRTWKNDESLNRLYLLPAIGRLKLSQISTEKLTSLHRSITKQIRITKTKRDDPPKGKSRTANRVISLASAIFGWAIKNKLCKDNPASGVEKNPEKSRSRFLMPEEFPAFFSAVKDEGNPLIRDFVLMALFTGARCSNLSAMRWDQISFDQKIWCISQTKNNEPLVVPLINEAVSILKKRKENGSAFVFPGKGKTGHLVFPQPGWIRILKRANISDFRLHDLRRTLGSWQAIMGSSTLIIGKSLGHKSADATAIYARLNLDPVRKSVETAAKTMLEAGEKTQK